MKIPAVSVQFMPDGLLILVVDKKQVWQKLLTWKEVQKIGKTGKKAKPADVMKGMTDKLSELIEQGKQMEADRKKRQEEWTRISKIQEERMKELKEKIAQGTQPLPPSGAAVSGT